jgi:hypothetical protein
VPCVLVPCAWVSGRQASARQAKMREQRQRACSLGILASPGVYARELPAQARIFLEERCRGVEEWCGQVPKAFAYNQAGEYRNK